MRKILTSLFVISAVLVSVAFGANAWLSDTEKSTGNAFTVGTIDIAVDGENPWTSTGEYSMNDMKPSYTNYINLVVKNVGNNPANVWKTLGNYNYTDRVDSEPECVAEGVDWDNGSKLCVGGQEVSNIDSVINYDMRVELYTSDEATKPVWWETIYMDEDGFQLSDIKDTKMYLGMIPAGWTMKVYQSYHMTDVAGVDENLYQGDGMTFDITLFAEQLTNEIRLVNKYLSATDVSHHIWNDKYADFSYKVMDDMLRWTLSTTDVPDGEYTLIVWDDTPDYDFVWPMDAVVLGYVNESANGDYTGSIDLGYDLINAKTWLIPGHHGSGVGTTVVGFDWNALNTSTFFETGLIDYYDSL